MNNSQTNLKKPRTNNYNNKIILPIKQPLQIIAGLIRPNANVISD